MKKLLFFMAISLFVFTYCDDETDNNESTDNALEGIFFDSPVKGLSYSTLTQSGTTDETGKFLYLEGESIHFSIGGIEFNFADAKDTITPLDLCGIDNPTISDQPVRNIAAFLQSLDSDGNPANGIDITSQVSGALNNSTLDFNSGSFYIDLNKLIEYLNTETGSSLTMVSANDAALHLAQSMSLDEDYEILPNLIIGRQWETGIYYSYNTVYCGLTLEIGSGLSGAKYYMSETEGYYLDMIYSGDTLAGYGNLYSDLNANPPVTPFPGYDYKNRISSPGFVFDYNDTTFLGYYNYFKKNGEPGRLQGLYEAFLYMDKKLTGENPQRQFLLKKQVIIEDPNEYGNFPVTIRSYNSDGAYTDENVIINKEDVDNENILLIRFRNTDFIYIKREYQPVSFHPGLFTFKYL